MFTKTFYHRASVSKEALKNRLLGNHVNIHDLDFEVMEKNESLRIVPHAEQIDAIKTLPITWVEMDEDGGTTRLKIISRMRTLDMGGPMLIIILCTLLAITGGVLWLLHEHIAAMLVLALNLFIFGLFRYRLEKGYFDYVRKIRAHIIDTSLS